LNTTALVSSAGALLADATIADFGLAGPTIGGTGSASGARGAGINITVQVESNGDENEARRFGSIVGESAATVIERNQATMQIRAGSGA